MTDAEPTEPQPFRGHHTAGQRLVLVVNCIIVVLCLAGAVGLIIGKNAGESGRKVIINAATTLPAAAADPGPPLTAAPGETLAGDTGTPSLPGRPDGNELPHHRRRQSTTRPSTETAPAPGRSTPTRS
jgi:hypothetical protein